MPYTLVSRCSRESWATRPHAASAWAGVIPVVSFGCCHLRWKIWVVRATAWYTCFPLNKNNSYIFFKNAPEKNIWFNKYTAFTGKRTESVLQGGDSLRGQQDILQPLHWKARCRLCEFFSSFFIVLHQNFYMISHKCTVDDSRL